MVRWTGPCHYAFITCTLCKELTKYQAFTMKSFISTLLSILILVFFSDVLRSQADGYVRAIQWNLHYYYNGVCSWSWFYPHHYAPYISDICNFSKNLELNFDMGKPFLPFQQLLAVLPTAR